MNEKIVKLLRAKGFGESTIRDLLIIINDELLSPEPDRIDVDRATVLLASRISLTAITERP